ncbi:hypothetical protein FPV67DRAFT_1131121 [Lyophyllum atratum]|nr:hypothetical protein FPV67DRAFT_1131121 [Lyophyllum atratum]
MFRKRRGRRFVERGDYALTNGDAEVPSDDTSWHALVKPGTMIIMHVVLRLKAQDTNNDSRRCPTCTYLCTLASLNDGVECPSCGTFFRVERGFVEEEIQRTPMLLPRMNRSTSSLSTLASKATGNDRDFECTDIRFFRRFLVRLEDLSLADAWSYIDTVKTYLPEKLKAFIDILKDFGGNRRLNIHGKRRPALRWVSKHNSRLESTFPRRLSYRQLHRQKGSNSGHYTAPFEQVANFLVDEYDRARRYLDKIRRRYWDDLGTYYEFLFVFRRQAGDERLCAEAYGRAQILFKDSPDLLADFKDFLPDSFTP